MRFQRQAGLFLAACLLLGQVLPASAVSSFTLRSMQRADRPATGLEELQRALLSSPPQATGAEEERLSDIETETVLRKGDILAQKGARGADRYWVDEDPLSAGSVYGRLLTKEGVPGDLVRMFLRPMLVKNYQVVQPVFFSPEKGLPLSEAATLITQTLAADPSLKGVYFEGRKMPAMERTVASLRPDRFLQEMRFAVADYRYLLFRSGSWLMARAVVVKPPEPEPEPARTQLKNGETLNFIAPDVPISDAVSGAFHNSADWLDGYEESTRKPFYPDTGRILDAAQLAEELWIKLLAPFYLGGNLERFRQEYQLDVTSPSGVLANVAVQMAVLQPGDSMVGLTLADGGQMTEGAVGSLAKEFFNILPFPVTPERDIDYDAFRRQLLEMEPEKRPRLLLVGGTAFVYPVRFQRLREIVDEVNGDSARLRSSTRLLLAVDLSQNFLQMLGGGYESPIGPADFVTWSVRHLGGPEGGLVLARKMVIPEVNRHKGEPEGRIGEIPLSRRVQKMVFPGTRAGYSARAILAKAALARHLATSEEFRAAAAQISPNAQVLAETLRSLSPRLRIRGEGQVHQILVDVRGVKEGMTGIAASKALESVGIEIPRNPFRAWPEEGADKLVGGLRISVKPLTMLGMTEEQFRAAGRLIAETIQHADPKTGEVDPSVRDRIRKAVGELLRRHGAGAEEAVLDSEPAQETAVGYVMDAGVGLIRARLNLDSPYLVVAEGMPQADEVRGAGVPAAKILVLLKDPEERAALLARGFPGDNLFIADLGDWNQSRRHLWGVAFEWMKVLEGVEAAPLITSARTLLGLIAQLKEILPSEWQGAITAESADQLLRLYQLGV